jgi:hypothetical protein
VDVQGRRLYTGNYVVARVEGQKLVLSSDTELQRLIDMDLDVEVLRGAREMRWRFWGIH